MIEQKLKQSFDLSSFVKVDEVQDALQQLTDTFHNKMKQFVGDKEYKIYELIAKTKSELTFDFSVKDELNQLKAIVDRLNESQPLD